MERILGKCIKKNCSHCFVWVAAMTYIQCFVLCFREVGPRAVTALYFGWPAFRNRHFVIWAGRGVGGGGALVQCETNWGHRSGPNASDRWATPHTAPSGPGAHNVPDPTPALSTVP